MNVDPVSALEITYNALSDNALTCGGIIKTDWNATPSEVSDKTLLDHVVEDRQSFSPKDPYADAWETVNVQKQRAILLLGANVNLVITLAQQYPHEALNLLDQHQENLTNPTITSNLSGVFDIVTFRAYLVDLCATISPAPKKQGGIAQAPRPELL